MPYPFHPKSDDPEFVLRRLNEIIRQSFNSIQVNLEDKKDSRLEDILEFGEYFLPLDNIELTDEKIKILMLLIDKHVRRDDEKKMMSFLCQTKYGWHNGKYIISNSCLARVPREHCKQAFPIKYLAGSSDSFESIFKTISKIFFDGEFGRITLLIFSYCLASLFISRLDQTRFNIPFLQIGCDFDQNNNSVYRLMQELVKICDINSGILDKCSVSYKTFGECGNYDRHETVYPTHFTKDQMSDLCYYQDIPIIIDGRENDRFYKSMLRELANIANRKKPLGMNDSFNLLPILVCPRIESHFNNILDFDFTGIVIDEEYLRIIKRNRHMLSAWVYRLVTDFGSIAGDPEKYPFSLEIKKNIDSIRGKHSGMDLVDADHIGFLSFFFDLFMKVFNKMIVINAVDEADEKVSLGGIDCGVNDVEKFIKLALVDSAEKSLIELNNSYIPDQLKPIEIVLNKSDPRAKTIEKEITILSRRIEKYYKSYGVAIHITKGQYVNKRYIFDVQILPGTDKEDLNKNAENVKLLLGYELFAVETKNNAIQIIASKKLTIDCDLISILESPEFKDSKMKIPYAMGKDIIGNIFIADLVEFPHLLIGGSTGAGKSTSLHSILMSIAYKQRVDNVNLLILDFGGSYLDYFNDIPHMSCPVISDPSVGLEAIIDLQNELEMRQSLRISNPREFDKLPYIVCIIDEFIKFIEGITSTKEDKDNYKILSDLIGRGRKERIIMVLSALNPTIGNIKCDVSPITARIAFRCAKWNNYHSILGETANFPLIGKGSMFFLSAEHEQTYLQGSFLHHEKIPAALKKIDFENDEKYKFRDGGKYRFTFKVYDNDDAPTATLLLVEESPSDSKNDEDTLLVTATLRALCQDHIAGSSLLPALNIGHQRAKVSIFDKWIEYSFIKKKPGNTGWQVIPTRVEDMDDRLIILLKKYGYSKDDISAVLSQRPSNAAAQSDADEAGREIDSPE